MDGAVLAKVVDAGSDGVPVESGSIGVAAEYFCDICAEVLSANLGCIRQSSSKLGFALIGAEVEEEVHDGVAGCGFDFLHGWSGC